MENENTVMTDIKVNETGKVSFAPDVIATIANLAASDVEGVTGLGGGFADSLTGILGGKKSYTNTAAKSSSFVQKFSRKSRRRSK